MRNLKGRVGKLEAQSPPIEPLFMLVTFVPARDGATEKGLQRIWHKDLTWLRKAGEPEDGFIARAKAEGTAGELKPGAIAWLFRADYGDLER